jgi:hypothetical protein
MTPNREFALSRAMVVTRAAGGRAVFKFADAFCEFIESGDGIGDQARWRALLHATGPGVDLPAYEIVAVATRYLESLARTDTGTSTRRDDTTLAAVA